MKNTLDITNTSESNGLDTNVKELIEKREIKETPFIAVRYDDKWFLTMGKYRLTEPMQTYEEVEEDARNTSWVRILQIMQIMIEEHDNYKKQTTGRTGEAVGEG